jgi:two-component system, NarL family, invasion response regulator UvrY
MINVLLVDDHLFFRTGLKQFISDIQDIVVADEAATGEEALNKAFNKDYDVILLDITLPDMNGMDVLKTLKSKKPTAKILMLTVHPEDQYGMRVLKSGASGYLDKENAPQELVPAIRKLASGGTYIGPSLAEKLAVSFTGAKEKPLYQTLTNREYQIMNMIASGKRLKDIANDLLLSVKTVSSHRSHILNKLNIKNNAELVRYALDNKLIK